MNNLCVCIWPCIKLVPLRVCENMQGWAGGLRTARLERN